MTLSLQLVTKNLRKWLALGAVLLAVNSGSVVFAQEDQDIDPAAVEIEPPATRESSTSSGTLSTGPWGGSTSTGSTRSTTAGSSTAAGPALRPGNGNTVLDPGDGPGNPDVPFDSNMNLAFLVVGLVFAFVVYKRRFAVKSEPSAK